MAGIAVARLDFSASELRLAAARSKSAAAARRMLALALVLEGGSRAGAASSCGMDRQSLRDWVHRCNADGLAALSNKRAPGPAAKLDQAQLAVVAGWVRAGPQLAAMKDECESQSSLLRQSRLSLSNRAD